MRVLGSGVLVAFVIACSSSSTSSSSGGTPDGGASSSSSSSSSSGASNDCVTIDPTTYDATCAQDSDCTLVSTGQICTGKCDCGGSPVNKKEVTRYEAAIAGVKPEACPCAYPGTPKCVQGACIICAFGPSADPRCPDGG